MHDFTHRFAHIFQSTLVSSYSRSKMFFKACNWTECMGMIVQISDFYPHVLWCEKQFVCCFFIIFIRAHKLPHYSSSKDGRKPHFLCTFTTLFHNFFIPFSFLLIFFISFFCMDEFHFSQNLDKRGTSLHFFIYLLFSPHLLFRLLSKVSYSN